MPTTSIQIRIIRNGQAPRAIPYPRRVAFNDPATAIRPDSPQLAMRCWTSSATRGGLTSFARFPTERPLDPLLVAAVETRPAIRRLSIARSIRSAYGMQSTRPLSGSHKLETHAGSDAHAAWIADYPDGDNFIRCSNCLNGPRTMLLSIAGYDRRYDEVSACPTVPSATNSTEDDRFGDPHRLDHGRQPHSQRLRSPRRGLQEPPC